MDLDFKINGDASGGAQAFTDVAASAKDSSKVIEDAFASMAKKTDAAFKQMEKERVAEAKKAADEIAAAEKKTAETIIAANKKIADAHHEQLVQQQADYLENQKKSEAMWAGIGNAVLAAGAAMVAFAVASAKAAIESERVSRQVTRAAGDYATALEQQASALSAINAVDDDVIKQSQILLTQWSGAGAAAQNVTQAVLDYAAATGQDAVSATQELIRNVESGGTGLAKLGVHYEATGDKAEDLKRATEALAKKFGGAAAADAGSLHGQLTSVGLAFEDLQKTIGGSIAEFLRQNDVAGKLTEALRGMQTLLGGGDVNEQNAQNEEYLADLDRLTARLEHRKELAKQIADFEAAGSKVAADGVRMLYAENEKAIGLMRMYFEERRQRISGSDLPAADGGETNKGMKEKESAAAAHATKMAEIQKKGAEDWKKYLAGIDDLEEASRVKDQESYADELEMSAKRVALAEKEEDDKLSAMLRGVTKQNDAMTKAEKERDAAAAKFRAETVEANAQAMAKQEQEWANAAASIGNAFVSTLSSELEKLAEGGEFDVAMFVGNILAAAFSAAATAVGAAYGQGAVGSLVGNLGALGIQAGARSISAANKRGRAQGAANRTSYSYHDGGWPRAHSGAWLGAGNLASDEVPIITQTGERVASRQEVKNVGGPAELDHILKGGSRGITNIFQVQALDAKSAAESFESEVGRGLKRARESGRGDVPALLGIPR